MSNLENRFEYPRHDDFFVAQIKEVTLKPEFKCIAEKRPECHNDEHYTERGTLLCLPEGPKYTYERDEINGYLQVNLWNVVSAQCDAGKLTAASVYPLHNETLFKDIPEIDSLISRLEKANKIGNVTKPELERVMPIIKNQRIAHEILNEVCEKYGMKRDDLIEVHAKTCSYGGPIKCTEPLDHTLFCYIGQGLYKGGSLAPYLGRRIFHIEFPGTDFFYERVKERFYSEKKNT